jgi:hypothetical protein
MQFYSPTITELAQEIKDSGVVVSPRGAATTELLGVNVVWPLGTYPVRDKMPRRLAAVEGVSLIAGMFDLGLIKLAGPNVDLKLFEQSSKYSLRIARQMPRVVGLLKKEPSTRRAIVYFGRPQDVGTDRTTCLTSLQFFVRDGILDLGLNMRSWDLTWGLPIDVVAVTALGLAVSRYLQVLPGIFRAWAGSLHIYNSSAHRAVSADPTLGRVGLNTMAEWKTWKDVQVEARDHMNESAWEWVKVQ